MLRVIENPVVLAKVGLMLGLNQTVFWLDGGQ